MSYSSLNRFETLKDLSTKGLTELRRNNTGAQDKLDKLRRHQSIVNGRLLSSFWLREKRQIDVYRERKWKVWFWMAYERRVFLLWRISLVLKTNAFRVTLSISACVLLTLNERETMGRKTRERLSSIEADMKECKGNCNDLEDVKEEKKSLCFFSFVSFEFEIFFFMLTMQSK